MGTLGHYYRGQLKEVKIEEPYRPTIQIRGSDSTGSKTKWIDINDESIPILIEYLNSLRTIKET
jgi:hypothetical protein